MRRLGTLWPDRTLDVKDYTLRQVGYARLNNTLGDLWRLIYADLGPEDDKHRPGAADEFLAIKEIDRGGEW